MSRAGPPRTLVLWGPAWPLVAAGVGHVPSVITSANRVTAVSGPARAAGVSRGMRRRQAQSRCGDLVVVKADEGLEARAFEPVVAAIEELCTGVEILRPGALALSTKGPSRYFGGDDALALQILGTARDVLDHPDEWRVGIGDGVFVAGLAARQGQPLLVVPPGEGPEFLADQSVDHLAFPKLVALLHRLGIHTLGRLAEVPEADLSARFGPDGVAAHRLARGGDERPLSTRRPPPDLQRSAEIDPPAEQVEAIAFVAKSLADELAAELLRRGLVCHSVQIEIETENGESVSRVWRHEGPFTAAAMSDRLRWQVDSWLTSGTHRPTGGINLLRLTPTSIGGEGGGQRGLWGGDAEAAERAARALARVQALLGPEAVVTAVPAGGRGPGERTRLVPWGDPRVPDPTADLPWPGQVPAPAPSIVHGSAPSIELLDANGVPVRVNGRGQASAPPAKLSLRGGHWTEVQAWAGPWPAEERWWDPRAAHRRARVQVVLSRWFGSPVRAGKRGVVARSDLRLKIEGEVKGGDRQPLPHVEAMSIPTPRAGVQVEDRAPRRLGSRRQFLQQGSPHAFSSVGFGGDQVVDVELATRHGGGEDPPPGHACAALSEISRHESQPLRMTFGIDGFQGFSCHLRSQFVEHGQHVGDQTRVLELDVHQSHESSSTSPASAASAGLVWYQRVPARAAAVPMPRMDSQGKRGLISPAP